MNLVETLAVGVRGAGGGTALITRRGDYEVATALYADYQGKVRRWGTLNLDSYGALEVYCNEVVDVRVYDRDGVLVREFTDGHSAYCVTIDADSDSFTDSTLDKILDASLDSFGAIDFNVLIGSTSSTLKEALGGLAGVFYNVKALAYGAQGDGATDDTRDIQRAIDAASLAGGGLVFFPKGTYWVSSQLNVPSGVSLIGTGSQSSVIRVTEDLERALYFYGYGADGSQRMEGLGIGATVAHSASLVTAVRGASLTVRSCLFGDANCTGPLFELQNTNGGGTTDRSHVAITACRFVAGGTAEDDISFGRCIASYASAATARLVVSECSFTSPATCTAVRLVMGLCVHLANCSFDSSAATAGTLYGFSQTNDTSHSWGSARGCVFSATGGATMLRAIQAGFSDSSDWFHESSNFATPSGGITYMRWLTSSSAVAGYYCKSSSRGYYLETTLPASNFDDIQISETQICNHAGIIANNCAFAILSGGGQPFVSLSNYRAAIGDELTLLGYACPNPLHGTGSVDHRTDCATDLNYHYAIPGLDTTVGTGYFAFKMRKVRTYGTTGPTLRSKWYCFGVGGTTKTGFVRKSY